MEAFASWSNHEHRRHSGIGWYTPASVHYGTAEDVRTHRETHSIAAIRAHP